MFPLAFGFGGPWDIAIVAGVIVLLFGGSKLPLFSKSLADSIKEFKKATNDDGVVPVAGASPTVTTPPVVAGTSSEEK